jgi:polyisoprenoid-binding protein YceI
MKNLVVALALTLSTLAFAAPWEIDTTHASASFAVKHMMLSKVNGKLGAVTGTVNLDDKDVTKSTITASIDATKIETQNEKRDKHLRSGEFLETEKFPTITFVSTKIAKAGEGKLTVTGDLTIHGVTKSVTLDAELSPEVPNPFTKAPTKAVTASTSISRKDFGLVWNMPMANNGVLVGDEVKIAIEAEVVKTEPAKK